MNVNVDEDQRIKWLKRLFRETEHGLLTEYRAVHTKRKREQKRKRSKNKRQTPKKIFASASVRSDRAITTFKFFMTKTPQLKLVLLTFSLLDILVIFLLQNWSIWCMCTINQQKFNTFRMVSLFLVPIPRDRNLQIKLNKNFPFQVAMYRSSMF